MDRPTSITTTTLDKVTTDQLLRSQPVREFRYYKGKKYYSGWMYSTTVGDHIAYESLYECARAELADFDSQVTSIAAQPFQVTWTDLRGKEWTAIPDYALFGPGREVTVVEVKAAAFLKNRRTRDKLNRERDLILERGWRFERWVYEEQPATRLRNIAALAGYKHPARIDTDTLATVRGLDCDGFTIREVIAELSQCFGVFVVAAVWHCVWHHYLTVDLDAEALGLHTTIRRAPGPRSD